MSLTDGRDATVLGRTLATDHARAVQNAALERFDKEVIDAAPELCDLLETIVKQPSRHFDVSSLRCGQRC